MASAARPATSGWSASRSMAVAASSTGVVPRTTAPTASARRSPRSSAPRAASIPTGELASSWTISGRGTPAARGPPSVRSAICWPAEVSSRSGGGGAPTSTRGWSRRPRRNPTISGPPTSKASSRRGGTDDLRARLPDLWPTAGDSHRQRGALCHQRHPRPLAAQRLVDAPRDPAPAHSPGTAAAERRPRTHAPDAQAWSYPSTTEQRVGAAAGLQSISDGVQHRAAAPASRRTDARVTLPHVPTRVPEALAGPGVPWPLPRQEDHDGRDVPLPAPPALYCQQPDAPSHRSRRNGRRDLVDLLQHRPAGEARRAGLHHSWLTQTVLPMFPDYSVTHHPGCSRAG